MVQTFYPGVYFKEIEFGGTVRPIQGVSISTGAIVGYFEKGPIGVPTKVTKANYQEIFGGPIENAFGWYAMNGFFENGGTQLWVVRVAHYTDVTDATTLTATPSKVTLNDRDTVPAETLEFVAKTEGVWGKGITVSISDDNILNTVLLEGADIGATLLKVKSVYGAMPGAKIYVGEEIVTIESVDATERTITITDGLIAAAEESTVVNSNEFKVTIKYKGVTETFGGLSINPLDLNYVENIINDEAKGSRLVVVNDLVSESSFPKNFPAVISDVKLTDGDDGLTGVGDADLIGSLGAKTGIYALAYVQDVFNLFIPESCSENVKRGMYQYCESRMDAFGIGSVPEGYTTDMAITFRRETGNFNTSFGALYYSWGYVNDPIGVGTNPQKLVPLDGHIAGMYARHDDATNIGEVPAGESAVLFGVNKLEHDIDDISNGDINIVNINAIRNLSGSGIVVWGARTLSSDSKWRYINKRRIFIYVEKSVAKSTRWVVFKPSNPNTWKSLKRTVDSFLNTVPGLYGETASQRYIVVCDETINTQDIRSQGQILTKIGLNTEDVGEFVVFEIGQMSEGVSITE